jgi:hypothetical protein
MSIELKMGNESLQKDTEDHHSEFLRKEEED